MQGDSARGTDGAGVGAALNQIFSPKEAKGAYSRSSTVNLIILASCQERFGEINQLLDALAAVHPGRYFVVYCDRELADVKVQVSARCVGLSAEEAVCSEVIMVGAAPEHMRAVPSVLRGNLLTGSPTELFLYERSAQADTFEMLSPLCDLVILDSSHFAGDLGYLREALAGFPKVVDLEWIGLGLWREQIKSVFNRQLALELLGHLSEVRVVQSDAPSLAAPLLGGWILERLGAERADEGAAAWISRAAGGLKFSLKLEQRPGPTPGVAEVLFTFKNPDWRRLGEAPRIQLRRAAGGIETVVESGAGRDVTAVPLEDESWLGRLKRYYGVGESTANYRASLERALRLVELKA